MKTAAVIFGRDWSARDAWPRARPHSPRGCASRSFQSLSYCGRDKKGTACSLLYRRYTRKSQSSAAGRDYSGCETLGRRFLQHRPPVGALLVMREPQVAFQLDAGDELLSAVLAHELLVAHVLADVSAQALQLLVGFGTPLASATTRNALLFLHFTRRFQNEERTFFLHFARRLENNEECTAISALRAEVWVEREMYCYFCSTLDVSCGRTTREYIGRSVRAARGLISSWPDHRNEFTYWLERLYDSWRHRRSLSDDLWMHWTISTGRTTLEYVRQSVRVTYNSLLRFVTSRDSGHDCVIHIKCVLG